MGEAPRDDGRVGVHARPTTVCLVRHGETDWNTQGRLQGREDPPLNARGQAQAHCCAVFLQQTSWDRVVTSPLRRAAETAAVVAEAMSLGRPAARAAFVERDYGAATGLSTEERRQRFADGPVPGTETREHLQRRAMRGLRALVARYPGDRIVLVAHGGVINAILAALSNGVIGSGKTHLDNACISIVHAREEAWEIECVNTVAHLDAACR